MIAYEFLEEDDMNTPVYEVKAESISQAFDLAYDDMGPQSEGWFCREKIDSNLLTRKESFIQLVKEAIVEDIDWSDIISFLPDCTAKGYLTARLEMLTNSVDDSQEQKEKLLEWCEYDIW